jgi:mitotic spindle assembly checkpoint protein MAD1
MVDSTQTQRIHHLETLLQEHKAANLQLSKEIDALGGDSSTLGSGLTREALLAQIKHECKGKLELQQGTCTLLIST